LTGEKTMKTIEIKQIYGRPGLIDLTNGQWEGILKKYLRFYKNVCECGTGCPMGDETGFDENDLPEYLEPVWQVLDSTGVCFCDLFYEISTAASSYKRFSCPCHCFGENAFVRLEEMLIRTGMLLKESRGWFKK
jgi:hypothetical protein